MKFFQKIFVLLFLTIGLFSLRIVAQNLENNQQSDYAPIVIPEEKQYLLKNVDVIANMNFNERNDFYNGEHTGSAFKFEQFRLEIKGYVNKSVLFRFRHRYTSTFEPQDIDKIVKGVDFAYLRINLTEKTQLFVGKMYADWGGWEFDLNPIMIYEYSDIIEQADNFLSGVNLYHQFTENHGFSFQLLNSRTGSFETIYDTVPNITPSKAPFAGVVAWRGSLFKGKIHTLWSYSLFTEAEGFYKNYVALGQWFDSKKLFIAYDFKISDEDLDRTGIISNEIPDNLYNYSVENTMYYSHWTRITWKFSQKWNFSVDGFIDYAFWMDDLDPLKTEDLFRTVYSFIPTIEYYPWEDLNMKFFLGGVQRYYTYSDYAKNRTGLGKEDYNTTRLIIGFISPLTVL